MYRKLFTIITILDLISLTAQSQFVKVSGKVTDFQNNPIPGANIFFRNSRANLARTDEFGNYATIRNVDSDSIIGCSHVNYKTTQEKIQGNSIINFRMYPKETGYTLPMIKDSTTPANIAVDDEKAFIDSVLLANKDRIFTLVEQGPDFAGGENVLMRYYAVHLRKANLGLTKHINGIITLSFIIKKDGTIENVKLVKGIQQNLDDEIIKLTKQLPKWEPAKQNGKPCDYNYVLSIPVQLRLKTIKRQ